MKKILIALIFVIYSVQGMELIDQEYVDTNKQSESKLHQAIKDVPACSKGSIWYWDAWEKYQIKVEDLLCTENLLALDQQGNNVLTNLITYCRDAALISTCIDLLRSSKFEVHIPTFINSENVHGETPLIQAIRTWEDPGVIINILLENKANPRYKKNGKTLLYFVMNRPQQQSDRRYAQTSIYLLTTLLYKGVLPSAKDEREIERILKLSNQYKGIEYLKMGLQKSKKRSAQ